MTHQHIVNAIDETVPMTQLMSSRQSLLAYFISVCGRFDETDERSGHFAHVEVGNHDTRIVDQSFLGSASVAESDHGHPPSQSFEVDQWERVLSGGQKEDVGGKIVVRGAFFASYEDDPLLETGGGYVVLAPRTEERPLFVGAYPQEIDAVETMIVDGLARDLNKQIRTLAVVNRTAS